MPTTGAHHVWRSRPRVPARGFSRKQRGTERERDYIDAEVQYEEGVEGDAARKNSSARSSG